MNIKCRLTAGFLSLFLYFPVSADILFSGAIEGELRLYPNSGLLEEQQDAMPSIALTPEAIWKSNDEDHSVKFKGFGRYSDPDGSRDHADIREFYYHFSSGSGWQIEAGINKVYWGVAESLHLVDIINQTDTVESPSGEEKLGQPMISFGLEKSWGNLDVYVLPYFREKGFNSGPERFQLSLAGQPIPIDKNGTQFESNDKEKHIDSAIRWGSSFDNLDVGISYFNGTNRDPIPIPLDIQVTSVIDLPVLKAGAAYYEQLEQLGLELQYLHDDLAIKFESASKRLNSGDYNSVVTGFEYTLTDLGPWGQDIGLLMEYLWNDRDNISVRDFTLKATNIVIPPFPEFHGLTETSYTNLLATLSSFLTPVELNELKQEFDSTTLIPGDALSPLENDIFVGSRFSLNDIGSTTFLAGFIMDADNQTTSASFEGSTRIGDDIRITLNMYWFENVAKNSAFYGLRNDDQIETKVVWFF